jgi:16S rRNA (guanine966-N2)-methyltransferase
MAALGEKVVDARVLDLFAGSGALGLEALSRGAREVVFVERSHGALRSLRGNIESLEAAARSTVVRSDAFRFLHRSNENDFDLALADPPYDRGYAAELLSQMAIRQVARELWVEHRSSEPMPSLPGLEQRRYGDTMISIWEASE